MLLRCESLRPPMSQSGHSRRLGVGRESACPQIPDMSGRCHIRRDVPEAVVSNRSKAPAYSITSSAMASSDGGTASPSMRAGWRLMTSSNFDDCTTGKSAGFTPLRMRPT
jgi:hypothetical protein